MSEVCNNMSNVRMLLICRFYILSFLNIHTLKENKEEGQCAQSKRRLLQLQIQALQVTERGYKDEINKRFLTTETNLKSSIHISLFVHDLISRATCSECQNFVYNCVF